MILVLNDTTCIKKMGELTIRGLGVERSLLDPKFVGSNPGGVEIGLHDFHDSQKLARILVQ